MRLCFTCRNDTPALFYHFKFSDTISGLSDNDVYKDGASKLSSKLLLEKEFTTKPFPIIGLLGDISLTPFIFNFDELGYKLKWRPSPHTDSNGEVTARRCIDWFNVYVGDIRFILNTNIHRKNCILYYLALHHGFMVAMTNIKHGSQKVLFTIILMIYTA